MLGAMPHLSASVRPEHIGRLRELQSSDGVRLSDAELSRCGRILLDELAVPASTAGVEIPLLVMQPAGSDGPRPGICFLHGGGMFAGDNRTGLDPLLDWVEALDVTIASVGYRLAPEHGHPIPVEDCYAALCWMHGNRERLGLANGPLMIAGTSAGGGLAAACALLARDRCGPQLSDQILMCPMLDDRGRFPSSGELVAQGVWDSISNRTGWQALLGAAAGTDKVSWSAAPGRATDLRGLPASFLDVGTVETFRDDVVDYAARLAQAGVATELHVWGGAFHGFDVLAPDSAVARSARATRIDYLRRRLAARAGA